MRASRSRSSGVKASPKSAGSKIWRISISANGPSTTVRLLPENLTRAPLELGWRPSPASSTPALTSSSLYRVISASSSWLGSTPASVSLSALSRTMNRIDRVSFGGVESRLLALSSLRRTSSGEIDMVRGSIRQQRHAQAPVAAEQHRARDRRRPEPLAHVIDRGVDGAGRMSAERQGQLHRAVVLQIGQGDADERQSLAGDQRSHRRQKTSGGGEENLRFGGGLNQCMRASGAREIVEAQPQHDRAAHAASGPQSAAAANAQANDDRVDLGGA